MDSLKNKVAIVTGAGSGIGLAIANTLAEAGARVVINDVSEQLVKQFVESGKGVGIVGDMSKLADIEHLVKYTIDTFGQLDILIGNVGVTHFSSFLEVSEVDYDRVLNLNLKGTFFLTQRAVEVMKNTGGKILLISSSVGSRAYPKLSIYSMTKAAINMLVRSLAVELGPDHIIINSLAPGPTATSRTLQEIEDYHVQWGDILPTGRPNEVEDIAKIARFLVSDDADQINGQIIHVDGGWNAMTPTPSL